MTTGDLKNNLRKLQRLLKQVGYKENVDYDGMTKGIPTAFLPVYNYALTSYSRHLASRLTEADIHLTGTTDLRFVELIYKVLRDVFQYKPHVQKEKFFSAGFAERKVIMCSEVIAAVQKFHLKHEPRKPTTLNKQMLNISTRPERLKSAPVQTSRTVVQKEPCVQKAPYKASTYSSDEPLVQTVQPLSRNTIPPQVHARRHPAVPHEVNPAPDIVIPPPVVKSVVTFADDLRTETLPVVEVVRMTEQSQGPNEQVRPIDLIAHTPGRQGLSEVPTLNYIAQRIEQLSNQVAAIDDRLATVEVTLGSQNGQQESGMEVDAGKLETILARITLIESRMRATDAKVKQITQGPRILPGPTAEEWNTAFHSTPNTMETTGASDSVSAAAESNASSKSSANIIDVMPDAPKGHGQATKVTTEDHTESTDCFALQDISNFGNSDGIDPRMSTPNDVEKGEVSFSTAFSSLTGERLEQVLRIQNMLKDTEDALKIN